MTATFANTCMQIMPATLANFNSEGNKIDKRKCSQSSFNVFGAYAS